MELKNYIEILWRRKWVILLTLVVTVAVVIVGTRLTTPVYQASAVLRIAVSSGGPLNYQEYVYADQMMNTYVEMATRRPVLEELMKRLALSKPPEIKAEIIPNTELIKITVEDTDPRRAAKAANTLADILIAQGNQLYVGGGKRLSEVLSEQLTQIETEVDKTRTEYEKLLLQTPPAPDEIDTIKQALQLQQSNYASLLVQYQQARFREEIQGSMITVFETAVMPQSPSKPRVMLNIILGFVVGLIGGLGLAFVFENLDTTLYATEDIESVAKLIALAKIPKANKKQKSIFQAAFSPFAEAFRNLATTIQQSTQRKVLKVLLVMSAEPNQGKSLIVSQLALSLAEFGKDVVAVDCDMRRPTLHTYFGLSNTYGLTDVLEQRMNLERALQKSSYDGVYVLASGPFPSHTSKLLGSPQMTNLINSLRLKFDYVLLDTPALLGIADVAALIQKAGGIYWVVRRAYARRQAVETARQFLAGLSDKSISLIINQAEISGSYGYYYAPQRHVWSTALHPREVHEDTTEPVEVQNQPS
jgi:non-specific protein-tyrosine kinase